MRSTPDCVRREVEEGSYRERLVFPRCRTKLRHVGHHVEVARHRTKSRLKSKISLQRRNALDQSSPLACPTPCDEATSLRSKLVVRSHQSHPKIPGPDDVVDRRPALQTPLVYELTRCSRSAGKTMAKWRPKPQLSPRVRARAKAFRTHISLRGFRRVVSLKSQNHSAIADILIMQNGH
jgi:hypothetical protein